MAAPLLLIDGSTTDLSIRPVFWTPTADEAGIIDAVNHLQSFEKLAGTQYYKLPSFRHPELSILQRELFPEDIPALLQLLELPRKSLLPDLRSAIREIYFNDFYYREFIPESIQPESSEILTVPRNQPKNQPRKKFPPWSEEGGGAVAHLNNIHKQQGYPSKGNFGIYLSSVN